MRSITITFDHDPDYPGTFAVEEKERLNSGLSWDEMLGQIASMTIGVVGDRIRQQRGALYPMRTQAEWDELARAAAERRAEEAKAERADDDPDF